MRCDGLFIHSSSLQTVRHRRSGKHPKDMPLSSLPFIDDKCIRVSLLIHSQRHICIPLTLQVRGWSHRSDDGVVVGVCCCRAAADASPHHRCECGQRGGPDCSHESHQQRQHKQPGARAGGLHTAQGSHSTMQNKRVSVCFSVLLLKVNAVANNLVLKIYMWHTCRNACEPRGTLWSYVCCSRTLNWT